MDELKKYIKECNLVFTDTLNRLDFCRKDFPGIENVEVNKENAISLFDFISSFNKLYIAFQKEYATLEKLNLGESLEIENFYKYSPNNNENYRLITFFIDYPTIIDSNYTILYLREMNGEIKPFITNDINPFDKNYYRKNIQIDEQIAKSYLNLFEKYDVLLKTFNYIKNCCLFGDGTNSLLMHIDNYKGNLLVGLNQLDIHISSTYFDTAYFIYLVLNLGENLSIDYSKCKLILDEKEIPLKKEYYDYVFKNLLINKEYTNKKEKRMFRTEALLK